MTQDINILNDAVRNLDTRFAVITSSVKLPGKVKKTFGRHNDGTARRLNLHTATSGILDKKALENIEQALINATNYYRRATLDHQTQAHILDEAQECWWRTQSATLALLKQACQRLDNAEQELENQEHRIEQLEELITTDELTGLRNRRGFYEAFLADLDRANRSKTGGMLILIDLDEFKSINDKYGHMAGDACLRLIAKTLTNAIRPSDLAGRLGGDEFVVLLRDTEEYAALNRAFEIGQALNSSSLHWYGTELAPRCSIGVRPYGPGDTPENVFNDADNTLYEDKERKKTTTKKNKKI